MDAGRELPHDTRQPGLTALRLSRADLANLAMETPGTPMHVGAVLVLDGPPGDRACTGHDRGLCLDTVRRELDRRLDALPELRRRLHRPGPFAGRPLWVDDPLWRIDRHVTAVEVAAPGDDAALLRLADALLAVPLDRAHPLWRIWFVTGLSGGRVAAILAVHHAVADGTAALRLLSGLTGEASAPAGPRRGVWRPAPAPRWSVLVGDHVRAHLVAAARLLRHRRPARLLGRVVPRLRTLAAARGAPRTSLNGPVGPRRRTAVLRLDLGTVKAVALRSGATVNDIVLEIAAGGLRRLLHKRGEATDVVLHAAMPVAPRSPAQGRTGNTSGIVVVPLPLCPVDPVRRIAVIHRLAARAKDEQIPFGAGNGLTARIAGTALARMASRHQHLTNVVVSNVAGPAAPIRLLGARVSDILPLGVLAGDLAISFLAFSYAGVLTIAVRADADRFPDLDVLTGEMSADWRRLAAPAFATCRPSPDL